MTASKYINITVLAIINESEINTDLIDLLMKEGIFEIRVSRTLKEGRELLERNTYDIVLVDLQLIDSRYEDIRTFHSLILSLDTYKFISTSFIILTLDREEMSELDKLEFRSLAFSAGAQDVFNKNGIKEKIKGLTRCIEDSNARTKHLIKLVDKYRRTDSKEVDSRPVVLVNTHSLLKPIDDFLKKYKTSN